MRKADALFWAPATCILLSMKSYEADGDFIDIDFTVLVLLIIKTFSNECQKELDVLNTKIHG